MRAFVAGFALAVMVLASLPVAAQTVGAKEASGKVTAISATSLTVESGSGASKTSKTFVLDNKTNVIARGATRATKGQERGSATSLIGNGDTVTVEYTENAGAMHAAQVRVTAKAKKS